MNKRSGFTFVELLISFFIVMLLILGTSQALIYSLYIKSRVKAQIEAIELSKIKLEYLKSLPFESPELQPDSRSETITQPDTLLSYQLHVNIIRESNNMTHVELEVYSDLHPEKGARIALLISRQLGF